MNAMTIQDVSALTARESVFWYFVGAINSAAKSAVTWLLLPFFIAGALLLAQIYPFRTLKVLHQLNAYLPCVQSDDDLELVRDMLILAYGAGRFYRRLCVFQSTMREAMEELDDTIDSLNMVLNRQDELKTLIKSAEEKRSPDLPLFHQKVAT